MVAEAGGAGEEPAGGHPDEASSETAAVADRSEELMAAAERRIGEHPGGVMGLLDLLSDPAVEPLLRDVQTVHARLEVLRGALARSDVVEQFGALAKLRSASVPDSAGAWAAAVAAWESAGAAAPGAGPAGCDASGEQEDDDHPQGRASRSRRRRRRGADKSAALSSRFGGGFWPGHDEYWWPRHQVPSGDEAAAHWGEWQNGARTGTAAAASLVMSEADLVTYAAWCATKSAGFDFSGEGPWADR